MTVTQSTANMKETNSILVIGGGWSGLAAAVELSARGLPVTLLESAKQVGGRARRSAFKPNVNLPYHAVDDAEDHHVTVDNGQHILIGAYRSTLSLLKKIGVSERKIFKRHMLYMHMIEKNKKALRLKVNKLPAPLHLVAGLISAIGIDRKDKIAALRFSREVSRHHYELSDDIPCTELFDRYQQSQRLVTTLWEPLCLAALNTQIHEASAQMFIQMLRESFSQHRSDSDYLFPRYDLGSVFPEPAIDFIERQGGHVRLAAKVSDIHFQDQQLVGVSVGNERIDSRHVILATSYQATNRLLNEHQQLSTLCDQLSKLRSNPICTVYLQFPQTVSMGREMTGFVNSLTQWIVDRSVCGNTGLVGAVISGDGPHMDWDNEKLARRVIDEVQQFFPNWPAPIQCMIVREKNATFKCSVIDNSRRPDNRTPVKGLYLAGDYTKTGLPGTLEGAIRSGLRSVDLLIQDLSRESNARHFT